MCVDVDFDRVRNNKSIFLCLAGLYTFPLPHPPFLCCLLACQAIIRHSKSERDARAKAQHAYAIECLRAFSDYITTIGFVVRREARASSQHRAEMCLPLTMNYNYSRLTSNAHICIDRERIGGNSYRNGTINLVFVVAIPFVRERARGSVRLQFVGQAKRAVGEWGESRKLEDKHIRKRNNSRFFTVMVQQAAEEWGNESVFDPRAEREQNVSLVGDVLGWWSN